MPYVDIAAAPPVGTAIAPTQRPVKTVRLIVGIAPPPAGTIYVNSVKAAVSAQQTVESAIQCAETINVPEKNPVKTVSLTVVPACLPAHALDTAA